MSEKKDAKIISLDDFKKRSKTKENKTPVITEKDLRSFEDVFKEALEKNKDIQAKLAKHRTSKNKSVLDSLNINK